MLLKIVSNSDERVLISVEPEGGRDLLSVANFIGGEEYISIDKGYNPLWTIHYDDGSVFSFSNRDGTRIFNRNVDTIKRLVNDLLLRSFIIIDERRRYYSKIELNVFSDIGSVYNVKGYGDCRGHDIVYASQIVTHDKLFNDNGPYSIHELDNKNIISDYCIEDGEVDLSGDKYVKVTMWPNVDVIDSILGDRVLEVKYIK